MRGLERLWTESVKWAVLPLVQSSLFRNTSRWAFFQTKADNAAFYIIFTWNCLCFNTFAIQEITFCFASERVLGPPFSNDLYKTEKRINVKCRIITQITAKRESILKSSFWNKINTREVRYSGNVSGFSSHEWEQGGAQLSIDDKADIQTITCPVKESIYITVSFGYQIHVRLLSKIAKIKICRGVISDTSAMPRVEFSSGNVITLLPI